MRILYFGSVDRLGHYLFEGRRSVHRPERNIPWSDGELDMTLCPGPVKVPYGHKVERQIEGEAALHHKDGWTALSFWDRSVDTRMNCNSTFVLAGTYTFEEAKGFAIEAYPWIWKRFNFSVVLREGVSDE